MNAFVICLSCAFLMVASEAPATRVSVPDIALADSNHALGPPTRCGSNATPPAHSKSASAFAPRPGRAKRRAYGAPIQGKILKTQPKKKVRPPRKPSA